MEFPYYPVGAATYNNIPPAGPAPRHPLARPRERSLTSSYLCEPRTEGLFVRVDVPGVQNITYSSFQRNVNRTDVSVCTNANVIHFRACSADRVYEWFIRDLSRTVTNDNIYFTITDGVFRLSIVNATGTLHFLNVPTPSPQNGLVRRAQVGARLHNCMPYVAYLPRLDEYNDEADLAGVEVYPQRIGGTGGVFTTEQIRGQYGGMLRITFDAPGANVADRYQLHINRKSPNMGWVEIKCAEGVIPRRVYSVAFATTCGCCYLDRPNMEVLNGVVTVTMAYLPS